MKNVTKVFLKKFLSALDRFSSFRLRDYDRFCSNIFLLFWMPNSKNGWAAE